jgi:hypothetical protein
MKSFIATSSDTAKPDKFLAFMVPSLNEVGQFMLKRIQTLQGNFFKALMIIEFVCLTVEC